MFTFSLLVPIAQDKDLELSYCIPSVRIIGSSRIVVIFQDTTEVTDPKPFKERPQNIPSGLLDEVKEHLDHMLNVGAIKPSQSAWSNAVVLVQKKGWGT